MLHYQPTVNLETGAMTGAEALIRWMDPDRGLIYPLEFVRIAEASGLIIPIGRWVLRGACVQAQAWIDEGRRPVIMAVNISAVEFRDRHFLEHVCKVLGESGLDPRYLELELTESSLMQHPDSSAAVLQALKDMGSQIAIDDFGTGYSSELSAAVPIDVLKIDQSFVHEISADPVGTSIVCAVIGMGKSPASGDRRGRPKREPSSRSFRPAVRRGTRLLLQPAGGRRRVREADGNRHACSGPSINRCDFTNTINAETAEAAEKKYPRMSRRALRALS